MRRPIENHGQRHDRRMNARLMMLIAVTVLLGGCGKPAQDSVTTNSPATANVAAPSPASSSPMLRMSIDGQPWIADHAIEGMVHPPGYDRAILISGSHGPKDKNEQAFTLLLLGVDGPGPRTIRSGGGDLSIVQMANLSPGRYLAGGVLGYDLQVELIRYSAAPLLVEATFSGTLMANDGASMVIADGHFFYAE